MESKGLIYTLSKGKLKDEVRGVCSQDQCEVVMVRGKCKFMLTQNTSLGGGCLWLGIYAANSDSSHRVTDGSSSLKILPWTEN